MKLAERVERLGDIDAQANHPLSAGRKYLRAGLYYLLAERMPSHKDPRRLIAYKRGIEVYAKGLKARREPVEFVEVPYGEHRLPAYFMKAPVPAARPAWCISTASTSPRRSSTARSARNTAAAASRC